MFRNWPFELFIWSGAVLLLACTQTGTAHFTLCPLDNAGISWCPGCGLGRSIRSLLHGEIGLSLNQHWFGIPALLILFNRILQLLNKFLLNLGLPNRQIYGKRSAY